MRFGMLVLGTARAADEHRFSGPPLVVDDPAGHRAPGLELDRDRTGLVPFQQCRADQLPAFMHDDHPARAGRVEGVDLEARRRLGDGACLEQLGRRPLTLVPPIGAPSGPTTSIEHRLARVGLEVKRHRFGLGIDD